MDLKKSKEGDRRSASSSSRLTSFDVVRANSLDNPQGTSSRDTSYIYGEKLEKDYQKRIRSLRKEGLDKLFLDRIQPTLQKAGLNINDSKSWDSNQEGKKFMDIVEEASNQGVKESGNPCLSKPRSEHESHFRWKSSRTPC
jgi:hypothetical protein